MNEEITFLIGAGAETKPIYNLPSGKYFKSDIITNDNLNEIFSIFNEKTSIFVDNKTILKHNASSTLYQTIKENLDDYNACSNKFSQNDKNIIKGYLNYKSSNNVEENNNVSLEFKNLYYNEIYKTIINNNNKGSYSLMDFYLEHLSFCSYVDSYFNFLRNVDLYTKECSRVIKLYYSAFQTIIYNIGSIKEKIQKIKGKDTHFSRKQFVDILNDELDILIDKSEKNENNYYYLIKEFKDKYNSKIQNNDSEKITKKDNNYINIITTNYTSICQKVLFQEDDKIAYVHGKLNLFENIYTKEIKDLCEFKEDEIIMPYIMIPSGIKPIISPYQIIEWNKSIKFIKNSNYVIIIGYGINSDDEHITTILREYVCSRKYIFFLYSEKNDKDVYSIEKNRILNIFGYPHNFYFFKTNDFKQVLDNILNNKELKSSI